MANHLSLFGFECASRGFLSLRAHEIRIRVEHHHAFVCLDSEILAMPLGLAAPHGVDHALDEHRLAGIFSPEAPKRVHQSIRTDHVEDGMRWTTHSEKMCFLAYL